MKMEPQPGALYLLFCVRMWECFSFYGMRALLVLYMVQELGFSDSHAFGIYAIYCALVEMGGVVGGRLADSLLGLRGAITLGGTLIALGHLCLALGEQNTAFFWSLALIVAGSSLFSGNITALLGQFYQKEDARREAGFTLFYMGINVGALLATLLCGAVGEMWGWHYGFGLAAIGMVMGNVAFLTFQRLLEDKGCAPIQGKKKRLGAACLYMLVGIPLFMLLIHNEDVLLPVLPWMAGLAVGYTFYQIRQALPLSQLVSLAIYLGAFSLFFAAEEQIGSSLMLFSEKYSTKSITGFAIPSTSLLSVNPTIIILGGFILNRFSKTSCPKRLVLRMGIACAIGTAAFLLASTCCLWPSASEKVPAGLLILAFGMISLAELLLAPAVIAHCSAIAPKEHQGIIMSLIPLGFSFASLMGGFFSKAMAADLSQSNEIDLYRDGFTHIALTLGLVTFLLIVAMPILQLLLNFKQKRAPL
jgi:POT family proton-dependent oligopeptide transporter